MPFCSLQADSYTLRMTIYQAISRMVSQHSEEVINHDDRVPGFLDQWTQRSMGIYNWFLATSSLTLENDNPAHRASIPTGARCGSVVRAFADGAMDRSFMVD